MISNFLQYTLTITYYRECWYCSYEYSFTVFSINKWSYDLLFWILWWWLYYYYVLKFNSILYPSNMPKIQWFLFENGCRITGTCDNNFVMLTFSLYLKQKTITFLFNAYIYIYSLSNWTFNMSIDKHSKNETYNKECIPTQRRHQEQRHQLKCRSSFVDESLMWYKSELVPSKFRKTGVSPLLITNE